MPDYQQKLYLVFAADDAEQAQKIADITTDAVERAAKQAAGCAALDLGAEAKPELIIDGLGKVEELQ
jgi:hypothetical protein